MPTLAIDRDFLADLAKLDKPVVKRVSEVFGKFEEATHTGLHLEKIANARNPRLRSIRIDQFWRGIVLAPEHGDVYTLLKVLPHDAAYDWAQGRTVSVNTATGGIEIRDANEIDRQIPTMQQAAAGAARLVFEHVGDADLARLGIDDQVLAFARTVTDAAQLDAAKSFLPGTQWDVLFGLAAGYTPEEVWADLGAAILAEPVDTDDLDAAILRSRDRVVLVDGPDELMEVFAYPFATWRVYLHPTQRAVVDADYSGPARVTGGPGTGKTVVALHRAHRLAQRGDGKVLVTTFTSTLSESLQTGLDMLVDDDIKPRLEVIHVDKLAHRVFRREHGAPRLLGSDDETALWTELIDRLGLSFTPVFLAEEWRQVVLAQRIDGADAYLTAKRTGRGRPLGSVQRAQAWQAIFEFEHALTDRGLWTHETVRREATRLLEATGDKPYRHVVVDEAQDLSPDQWRLLRAAVAEGSDDLFIAGDTHQRIYQNRSSFREVGINIAGRSTRLNLNYRTTAEILSWSLGLLRGQPIDDMDGGLDSIAGCRSTVHGAAPRLEGAADAQAEAKLVAAAVGDWLAAGVSPAEIGIAVRARWFATKIEAALRSAGIDSVRLADASEHDEDAVRVGTMHRMKGLEFRCVCVAGVSAKQVPEPNAVTAAEDDRQTHGQDVERERCLLFVACTRAREELLVTWHGEASPFLTALESN